MIRLAVLVWCACSIANAASVRDYGAVGDGRADDTAAFTAAIAATPIVQIPPGTYRVSQIAPRSGTQLIGADRAATVILDSGGTAKTVDGGRACVLILDTCETRVANLTIRGRGYVVGADDIGLCLHAAQRATIENVTVESFAGRGVWCQHQLTKHCVFRGLEVRDIRQSKGRYGIGLWIYGSGSGGASWKAPHHLTFFETMIAECVDNGVCLDAGTSTGAGFPPYAVSFSGLVIRDCAVLSKGGASALGITGGQHCSFNGLFLSWEKEKATGPAVFFGRDQTGVQTQHCTVSNVSVHRAWTTPFAKDATDGTNTISNATVHQETGKTVRIGMETY